MPEHSESRTNEQIHALLVQINAQTKVARHEEYEALVKQVREIQDQMGNVSFEEALIKLIRGVQVQMSFLPMDEKSLMKLVQELRVHRGVVPFDEVQKAKLIQKLRAQISMDAAAFNNEPLMKLKIANQIDIADTVAKHPIVRDFDKLFPGTVHVIQHYSSLTPTWRSHAPLHQRYNVIITFPWKKENLQNSDFLFFLNMLKRVEPTRGGNIMTVNATLPKSKFTLDDWKAFVSSGGNWEVLDVDLIKDQPVPLFDKAFDRDGF